MNIREEARKRGGEGLLAKLDKAMAAETGIAQRLTEVAESVTADLVEGTDDKEVRALAKVAIVEALGTAYAKAVIDYGDAMEMSTAKMLTLTLQSIANKLQQERDSIEAAKAGIGDKITQCFKGVGEGK